MTSTQAALSLDAENRIKALELASYIVEAPAGAGKTELLTQRFLKLLLTVEQPEEIIAITFTKKAAAEMRSRIISSLMDANAGAFNGPPHKQLTYSLSQKVIERSVSLGWALLENPARLRLYTIDGLCATLSRQMPLMSRFGAQPNVSDDVEAHYLSAVQKTLALIEDETYQPVIVEALRYLDNDSQLLTQLLVSMLAKRDQWIQLAQTQNDPDSMIHAFEAVIDKALEDIATTLGAAFQVAVRPFAIHAAKHLDVDHPLQNLSDWTEDLPPRYEALPKWLALAELMLTGSNTIRKRVNKNNGFPPADKAIKQDFESLLNALQGQAVETALARLRQLPLLDHEDDAWGMINTLSHLLSLVAAQLWLVFSQAGEVDFIEVSQRAIAALSDHDGSPTDLALRLDYQIKHILVDEFQDTSPSQIQLLDDLTKGWQPNDGRTLFLVGDPMQSIYRFRKAEVGLFLNAAKQGIGDVKLNSLRLYRNNRSCPTVIEWVNNHFESALPAQDAADAGAIQYRPFMSTREPEDGEGVYLHPIAQSSELSLSEARQEEANAVVALIIKTRQEHPEANIAVLGAARSHLMPVVMLLRKTHRDIAFQAVDVEALNDRQVIQDLLLLTRALLHRGDRVSWLALLRAPWCGLTLNDLHALAGHDHQSTIWSLMQRDNLGLSDDGLQRLQHLKAIMYVALLHQGRQSISRWVYGVWLQLNGPATLWKASDSADVEAYFDCIRSLESQEQFSIVRLEQSINKLYAAPDPSGDKLQLMTIHKSKGLEFDTVIVTGMGNKLNRQDDQPIVRWESVPVHTEKEHGQMRLLAAPMVPKANKEEGVTPYDYLRQLEKQRTEYEEARVLYVAVTRAVRVLHLVGIVKISEEGDMSVSQATYFGLLWSQLKTSLPAPMSNERTQDTNSVEALANFSPKLIRLTNLEVPHVVKTHEKTILKNNNDRKKEEEEGHQLKADIGTLTHYYLEKMCQRDQAWTVEAINSFNAAMQYWFKQRAYSLAESEKAANAVVELLVTTLNSDDGQWLMQSFEEDQSELAMLAELGGDLNRQVLDRTFIADKDGMKVRWIVDYKTVTLSADLSEEALLEATKPYHDQLDRYAAMFSQGPYPVQKAIFFVSIGRLVEVHNDR